MTAVTRAVGNHTGLAALASHYVEVAELPSVPTRCPGVDMRSLMKDKDAPKGCIAPSYFLKPSRLFDVAAG